MSEPVTEHTDEVEPDDFVDPSELEDYSEVDSTTVDSTQGAPV